MTVPQVDLHTHVLPGIDDGARDLTQALAMLRIAAEDGTGILVATPHARRCTVETVRAAAEHLRRASAEAGSTIVIEIGMEEQLLPDLLSRLRSGHALTIANTSWVLVELPDWTIWPSDLAERLGELRAAGFRPLLAHVERYVPIQQVPERICDAIAAGAAIQINADSLFGQNGYAAQRTAARLLQARAVSVLASDAHSPDWRAPRLAAALDRVAALVDPDYADALRRHAFAIVRGEAIALPEPDREILAMPRSLVDRIRAWVSV